MLGLGGGGEGGGHLSVIRRRSDLGVMVPDMGILQQRAEAVVMSFS